MKNHIFFLRLFIIFLSSSFFIPNGIAQDGSGPKESSLASNAAGISMGWYNPSLDYWKEEDPGFKDADFKGAIHVRGFYEFRFMKNFYGQAGLGYWQSSTEANLQGFGNTKLLITGIPISLDILYHIEAIKFSVITPYVGIGGEYTFIQNKFDIEQVDNPDPANGSTFLGNGIVGLEAKLSEKFAMDLEFRYKFGSYKQDFKNVTEDPENQNNEIVEEKISLNGPYIGLTFKYVF